MKRHVNIPIFIPHLGCPNACVFCNQRTISGVSEFKADSVRDEIDKALSTVTPDCECEIAFFGGSFTGIDRSLMTELLEIANSYIKAEKVSSVRCSTRPDYIDSEVIEILKSYGVKTVELGFQSISERVLQKTKRGHTASDEINAARLITESGLKLVGQMMIGLPESTEEDEIKTAEFIINAGATGARIYPTVVFRDTELCKMAISGEYKPLTTDEAVRRSSSVFEKFFEAGVDVIRIGLQSSENLSDEAHVFAGASHSALGELVLNEFYYKRIKKAILNENIPPHSALAVEVPKGDVSKAVGQKKKNKLRLTAEHALKDVRFVEKNDLTFGEVSVHILKKGIDKCI